MDPVTHTLVGATLAETRLARDIRLGGAALIVGANLPDVDALSLFVSTDFALGFRRGWTHGVLADLILPLLLCGMLLAWDRRVRRRSARRGLPPPDPLRRSRILGLCYLGVLSHPALDWLNTYGVRLLMPFDGRWFYGDALFIADPWLWLALGGTLLLARQRAGWGWVVLVAFLSLVVFAASVVPVAARVAWTVGVLGCALARFLVGQRLARPRTAVVGLVTASLYVVIMLGSTLATKGWVRARLEQDGVGTSGRLMVGPLPASPFRRDVLAEVDGGYRYGAVELLAGPRLELAELLPVGPQSPVLDVALAAPELAGAVNWMRFPFAEIEERPDGFTVYLLDARYVRRRTTGFGSAVLYLDRERVGRVGE